MKHSVIHKKEDSPTRRDWLFRLLGGSLALFIGSLVYPVLRYLQPPRDATPKPRSVAVGSIEELNPNSGKVFRFGNEPAILIRTRGGQLRAFSAVCTHLACTVQYREDLEHIWCACHDGHYDLNGINIQGPPPRPLEPFRANIKSGQVFVTRNT